MYRKADRERLIVLEMWCKQFDGWPETISAQLKALSDGQDKLLQSHAALEKACVDGIMTLSNDLKAAKSNYTDDYEDSVLCAEIRTLTGQFCLLRKALERKPKANGKRK